MEIIHEETGSHGRYSTVVEGHTGEMTYSRTSPQLIIVDHTLVPDALRGKGVGQALAKHAIDEARKVLVATETGMLHQLRGVNATTEFQPVNRAAVCKYMKMITPSKLLRSLRDGTDEVTLDPEIARRALRSVERMIAIGTPSPVAE